MFGTLSPCMARTSQTSVRGVCALATATAPSASLSLESPNRKVLSSLNQTLPSSQQIRIWNNQSLTLRKAC